jgi:broad specificity polyphosphatase/5'/3'-nucleotidase SurE
MKLKINVPVEKIQMQGCYTFRDEQREVDVKYVVRRKAGGKNRYYYTAHYVRHKDEVEAHNNSNIDKTLAYSSIDRKANKHFKPLMLEFLNDLHTVSLYQW